MFLAISQLHPKSLTQHRAHDHLSMPATTPDPCHNPLPRSAPGGSPAVATTLGWISRQLCDQCISVCMDDDDAEMPLCCALPLCPVYGGRVFNALGVFGEGVTHGDGSIPQKKGGLITPFVAFSVCHPCVLRVKPPWGFGEDHSTVGGLLWHHSPPAPPASVKWIEEAWLKSRPSRAEVMLSCCPSA